MKHIYLDKIKSLESPPKVVNIFSLKEIEMIKNLYYDLPKTTFNKKQNVIKKAWQQNFNKKLDKMYYNKLREAIGDFKMDTLKSETGENYYGLFHESFAPLPMHVDSGFDEKAIEEIFNMSPPIGRKTRQPMKKLPSAYHQTWCHPLRFPAPLKSLARGYPTMDHFSYAGSLSRAIRKPSAMNPVTPNPNRSPSPIA